MKSPESWSKNCIRPVKTLTVGVAIHVTRQRSGTRLDNRAKMALLDSSFAADFKARTIQNDFPSPYFNLLWVYTSEGTKFCPTRNFKVDRGKSMNTHANIFIFNRFCKAFASLVVICLKKFLQESVDHPCNIQPPAARSIWRFRTW